MPHYYKPDFVPVRNRLFCTGCQETGAVTISRQKRETTPAFRDTLREMLRKYYGNWELAPLEVSAKTIGNWLSGKNTPNHKTFGVFLENAEKFPDDVKERLWQLYEETEEVADKATIAPENAASVLAVPAPPAAESREFVILRQIVDVISDLGSKDLDPKKAKVLIGRVREIVKAGMSAEEVRHLDFYIMLASIPIYRGLGQTEAVKDLLHELEREVRTSDDLPDVLRASFYHHRGVIRCYVEGRYEDAITDYQQAYEAFERAGQVCDTAGVFVDVGMAHWCSGDLINASHYIDKGYALAEANQCSETYLIATGNLGLVNLVRGKLEEALPLIQEHLKLAITFQHKKEIVRAQANRGVVYYYMGRYVEALNDLTIDAKNAQGQTEGLSLAFAFMALCRMKLNDEREALNCAREALWIAQKNSLDHAKIPALRAMAECAMDSESARAYLLEALDLARGSSVYQEAACELSLAKVEPDPELAEQYFRQGKTKLERMGAGAWITSPHREDAPFIMLVG